jgi:16S rRNA (guanine1207-N2)-methyltransferase
MRARWRWRAQPARAHGVRLDSTGTTSPPAAARDYDFIVSNPPFHEGRADRPELGRAFIAAAAAALRAAAACSGRQSPPALRAALAQASRSVRTLADAQGFKVIEARRA